MTSNNNTKLLIGLPSAERSLKTINKIFHSTVQWPLTKAAVKMVNLLWPRARSAASTAGQFLTAHALKSQFFFLFLSFSKHFAHATNQTFRRAGHFTTRSCILENIFQAKFFWKITRKDYVPKSGNLLSQLLSHKLRNTNKYIFFN